MKRLLIGAPIGAAIVAVVVLLAAGVLGGQGDGAGQGEYGTLYIDVLPDASNTATAFGAVDVCRDTDDLGGSLDVGDTFTIDVVIGGAKDLAAPYWVLYYNQEVLKVTVKDWVNWKMGSGGLEISDALPDSDGAFASTYAQTSSVDGDGVLLRVTLEAIGSGSSDLYLCSVAGDCPNMADPSGFDHFYPEVEVHDPPGEVRVVVSGACPPEGEGAGATPTPSPEGRARATPEPQAVRFRWGNVSLAQPAADSGIFVSRELHLPWMHQTQDIGPALLVGTMDKSSTLTIDAETGQVVDDRVRPEDRAAFDAILATVRVEAEDVSGTPWPYGTVQPDGPRRSFGNISYIEPDPASGIAVGGGFADGFDPRTGRGISTQFIEVYNTRSSRSFDARTGEMWRDSVHPDDREAFDRFTSTITVVEGR